MMAVGLTTRGMASEYRSRPVVLVTRVNGSGIINRGSAGRRGPRGTNLLANTLKARRMAMALISGLVVTHTMAAGSIIKFMDSARTSGLINAISLANGFRIKSLDLEFICGLMAENMKDSLKEIRDMVTEL